MINLLPYDTKQQIRAARTNTTLLKFIFFLGCGAAFLALACVTTYLFISNSKSIAETAAQNQSNANSSVVAQKVATIQTNLTSARAIISQQVAYSSVITGIAAALPAGVVVDSITLDESSFRTPLTLNLHAKSNDLISTLKTNFQKTALFSSYSLQSSEVKTNGATDYPVEITITITINKGAIQ